MSTAKDARSEGKRTMSWVPGRLVAFIATGSNAGSTRFGTRSPSGNYPTDTDPGNLFDTFAFGMNKPFHRRACSAQSNPTSTMCV
jgi:hypothetical protein